ncbi:MAG: VWA domain-containing protein [Actinomycetia bacterium]|nr:VWA domain-containing protein [Actinomycetes bacterium]
MTVLEGEASRQGVGGATLRAGGRIALPAAAMGGALWAAVQAWAGDPRRLALKGRRHGLGGRINWARTIRAARRTGGRLVRLVREPEPRRPLDLVVLWDVSGSMAEYIPHYLPWLYGVVGRRPRTRVVIFGTEAVDVTALLHGPYARARATLEAVRHAWGGGTAIGRAVDVLNADVLPKTGPSVLVVVISDGWEAEPEGRLNRALARLKQRADRLVWINPLAATPGYRPVQRGIVVARRYADRMAAGASYPDLETLGLQEA